MSSLTTHIIKKAGYYRKRPQAGAGKGGNTVVGAIKTQCHQIPVQLPLVTSPLPVALGLALQPAQQHLSEWIELADVLPRRVLG